MFRAIALSCMFLVYFCSCSDPAIKNTSLADILNCVQLDASEVGELIKIAVDEKLVLTIPERLVRGKVEKSESALSYIFLDTMSFHEGLYSSLTITLIDEKIKFPKHYFFNELYKVEEKYFVVNYGSTLIKTQKFFWIHFRNNEDFLNTILFYIMLPNKVVLFNVSSSFEDDNNLIALCYLLGYIEKTEWK